MDCWAAAFRGEPKCTFSSVPVGRGFFVPMTLAADTQVVTESLSINSAIRFDRGYDLEHAIKEA